MWKVATRPPRSLPRVPSRPSPSPALPQRLPAWRDHRGGFLCSQRLPKLIPRGWSSYYTKAWSGPLIKQLDHPHPNKFYSDYTQPRKVMASEDRVAGRIHKAALLGDSALLSNTIASEGKPKVSSLLSTRIHGMTPLHYACLFGHFEMVKEMIALGADPLETAASDVPPEQYSANWPLSSGNTSRGYIVDLNDEQLTSIHLACCAIPRPDRTESVGFAEEYSSRTKLISYLARCGVDPHAQTKVNQMTALHYAAIFGLDDCCKILVDLGLHPILRENITGDSPLSLAVKEGNAITVKTLVKRGDNKLENYHAWGGINLLHLAIDRGNTPVVKVLLELGADVNAATMNDEETPLLLATRKGDLEMVKLILDHKPDVNHRNVSGMTALHVAYSLGLFDIVGALSPVTQSSSRELEWDSSSSECIINPDLRP